MSHEQGQDRTHSPDEAQEVPSVVRELQAARETKWAEAMTRHRVEVVMVAEYSFGWQCLTCKEEGWAWTSLEQAEQASLGHHATNAMALAALETFGATSGLRQELAQAQAENERLRTQWVDMTDAVEGCDHPYLTRVRYDFPESESVDRWLCISDGAPSCHWTISVPKRAALAAEPTPAAEPHAEDGACACPTSRRDTCYNARCPDPKPCHAVNITDEQAPVPDPDYCTLSQRVDGKRHSWKFDGDDPHIICHYCEEMRDAMTGRVIRPAPVADPSGNEGGQG